MARVGSVANFRRRVAPTPRSQVAALRLDLDDLDRDLRRSLQALDEEILPAAIPGAVEEGAAAAGSKRAPRKPPS